MGEQLSRCLDRGGGGHAHAAVVEQPDAISDALIDHAKTLWPKN
jgi:hypothetical protein